MDITDIRATRLTPSLVEIAITRTNGVTTYIQLPALSARIFMNELQEALKP
jgi:hypothetical protein